MIDATASTLGCETGAVEKGHRAFVTLDGVGGSAVQSGDAS